MLSAAIWLLLFLCFAGIYRLLPRKRIARWPWLAVGGVFIMLQCATAIYRYAYNGAFELALMLDIDNAVVPTLINIYGLRIVVLFAVLLPYLIFTFAYLLNKLCARLQVGRKLMGVSFLVIALWLVFSPQTFLSNLFPHVADFFDVTRRNEDYAARPGTLLPELAAPIIKDKAPVIIIQLESVSAMATDGLATGDGPGAMKRYMPEFTRIAKQGVMVPYMWGTTVETHRGQGTILCGSITDTSLGISSARKPMANCLPNILKPQGYTSYFMSAYWDGTFAGTQNLLDKAGFDHVDIGAMMHEGDKKLDWGYEDCGFYKRSFDKLADYQKNEKDRGVFAYFAVSGHHYIFNADPDYKGIWPFKEPKDFAQRYLNSLAMQDHCLGAFMDESSELRKRAHVFILGDHSWPVGLSGYTLNKLGSTSENFLIPLVYLPPTESNQYRRSAVVTSPMLGQADIEPTILELLSGTHYPNSFAFELKSARDANGEKAYEDCQVSTQPYEGVIVNVVRGRDKYTYYARDKLLEFSTLRDDRMENAPHKTEENISYRDFRDRFFCKRYQALQPKAF